jgi:hypothetical protein
MSAADNGSGDGHSWRAAIAKGILAENSWENIGIGSCFLF